MANQVTKDELVALIVDEWSASYSDNGAIWKKAFDKLLIAKESADPQILHEAFIKAREVWHTK